MDDFLEETKSLDELHAELILELKRLAASQPEDLTFSDADVILYILDLYFKQIHRQYKYLEDTPRLLTLNRLKRNLDDQLKLMESHQSPDDNLWFAAINLSARYLSAQNSHAIA